MPTPVFGSRRTQIAPLLNTVAFWNAPPSLPCPKCARVDAERRRGVRGARDQLSLARAFFATVHATLDGRNVQVSNEESYDTDAESVDRRARTGRRSAAREFCNDDILQARTVLRFASGESSTF